MMRDDIVNSLAKAAEEYGLARLSRETGINRTHFYRIFSERGNPSIETILRIAQVLGFKVVLVPNTF